MAVGKNIRENNINISYPGQVWIRKDEEIYKTFTCINGLKRPTKVPYWRHVNDFISPGLIERAPKYSQLGTFHKGQVVKFGTEYWQCMVPHGYETGEIHIPGVEAWRQAEITPWEPNMEWMKNQVCSFNDQFYQFLGEDDSEDINIISEDNSEEGVDSESTIDDVILTPEEDERWGLIGEYSETLEYDFSEGACDYVVAEGAVFYPVLNPNPDKLIDGVNIIHDDPRNSNVVAHLSRIALYHLHSIISPTNIPETRRWAYEAYIHLVYISSKFNINPQLPRKKEHESCAPKVDWAMETFQRSYDPNENIWLI